LTALEMPGVLSAMSTARMLTSSVRASAAPGGSCVTMMRKPRSTAGMKPVGVLRNSLRPNASTPAYTTSISTAKRTTLPASHW
jgi:hypothetical protein